MPDRRRQSAGIGPRAAVASPLPRSPRYRRRAAAVVSDVASLQHEWSWSPPLVGRARQRDLRRQGRGVSDRHRRQSPIAHRRTVRRQPHARTARWSRAEADRRPPPVRRASRDRPECQSGGGEGCEVRTRGRGCWWRHAETPTGRTRSPRAGSRAVPGACTTCISASNRARSGWPGAAGASSCRHQSPRCGADAYR